MNNGFDKDGFMNWLKEEFPGVIDTHWNWEFVENIIDYALENKNSCNDEFAMFYHLYYPK